MHVGMNSNRITPDSGLIEIKHLVSFAPRATKGVINNIDDVLLMSSNPEVDNECDINRSPTVCITAGPV